MPPLWLIVGVLIIGGLTMAVDRVILKSRGSTLIIDGKTFPVRRKRDSKLLMALMWTMLIIYSVLGFTLFEEGNLMFNLIVAIPFIPIAVWSFWQALREKDRLPTEKEVSVGMRASKAINRHAWQAFAAIGVQIALGALISATHGALFWMALALNLVLIPVEVLLLWRFLRTLRAIRTESPSI